MVLLMFLCGCTAKSSHDDGQIDLDLTFLDDSLAYVQLVSIIKEPAEYIGKRIRLKGAHSTLFNGYSGSCYHECTIQDLTLCCAQGIEFTVNDKNYPEEGEIIILSGTLDLFEEGKHSCCYVRDAVYTREE